MEQRSFEIEYSNVTKLDFTKCEDCPEQVVCPHAGIRKSCRTVEKLKEVHWDE